MSSENGNNQQQVQQPDNAKLPIVCPRCSQHFSVKIPKAEIANSTGFSAIIMPHPNPVRCIGCHQAFVLMFGSFQVQVVTQAVGDELFDEDKRIIVPDMAAPKLKLM